MNRFGCGDISQAHMTDPLSMRNVDNQKSNVTFVPAVNQGEGLAEMRKTQQFGRHPSCEQYNTQQYPSNYPSNQMLVSKDSEINTIESNTELESLPVVVRKQQNDG